MPFPLCLHHPAGAALGYLAGLSVCAVHRPDAVPTAEAFVRSLGTEDCPDVSDPDPLRRLGAIARKCRHASTHLELADCKLAAWALASVLGCEPGPSLSTAFESLKVLSAVYDDPLAVRFASPDACHDPDDACATGMQSAMRGLMFGYSGLALHDREPIGAASWYSLLDQTAVALEFRDNSGWPGQDSLIHFYRYLDVEAVEEPSLVEVDDGLFLGNYLGAVQAMQGGAIDSCISLCRAGGEIRRPGTLAGEVWINDSLEYAANPNLPFVFLDVVGSVLRELARGRSVLVHCAVGRSRSPSVASCVMAIRRSISVDDALLRIRDKLPSLRFGSLIHFSRAYLPELARRLPAC